MNNFDKITIQEMSKSDMLLIIQALEYTGQNTKIDDFLTLKDSFIKELSILSEIPEKDFIDYLQREAQAL
ncbi:MAG: hypothetical protein ACOXZT_07770 [Tissierellaceae bacterium]|jgi:hypothetical protein|nr:hypothetical protein [Tissierellia bacterium]